MLVDPANRDDRLAVLGTDVASLEQVVRAGDAGWRRTTSDHGSGAGGTYAYRERLASLRQVQRSRGWENAVRLQNELTVDPNRKVAFQTMLGDEYTGNPAKQPRTRYPRGANGKAVLEAGTLAHEQMGLFDISPAADSADEVNLDEIEEPEIWVLLVHRAEDPETGAVTWASELSKPKGLDQQDRIDQWAERIPLPSIRMDSVIDGDREDVAPGTLDIPVDFRNNKGDEGLGDMDIPVDFH